jgi:hypothetical protein
MNEISDELLVVPFIVHRTLHLPVISRAGGRLGSDFVQSTVVGYHSILDVTSAGDLPIGIKQLRYSGMAPGLGGKKITALIARCHYDQASFENRFPLRELGETEYALAIAHGKNAYVDPAIKDYSP